MKNITQTANVYQTGSVAERLENPGELAGAGFLRPPGDADKEVIAGLANVAAVDCSRLFDRAQILEMTAQNALDVVDLAEPAVRPRPRDHRAAWRDDRRVFDKSRIRMSVVRRQAN